ncbi:MAG: methyl-accepting chemotaxis protein [Planctomycetota bacterium]
MRLRIAPRFWLGFGVVLALMTVMTGVSVWTQRQAVAIEHELEEMVVDATTGNRARSDLLMMRMNVKDYLINHKPEDVEKYESWRAKFDEQMVLAQGFDDPKRAQWIDEVAEKYAVYHDTFSAVQASIQQADTVHKEVLRPLGVQIRKEMLEALHIAAEDQKLEETEILGEKIMNFMLARYYGQYFILTGDESAYQRAMEEFQSTHDAIDELAAATDDQRLKDMLAIVGPDVQAYRETLDRIHTFRVKRDELVLGTLDVFGPQIADLLGQVSESLEDDSHTLSEHAAAAAARATTLIVGISAFAILIGLGAAFLLARSIVRPVHRLRDRLDQIANGDGDLTQRIEATGHDELADVAKLFNKFMDSIHDVIAEAVRAANDVAAAATQISASSEQLSGGSQDQSNQVTQVSAAVEELSASVIEVARKAADAANNSQRSGEVAEQGGVVVEQTVDGMNAIRDAVASSAQSVNELGKRGEQIGAVIQVINDIADQTNLLALNAAIEAARAGEHGRGFAVVADEVRKLADRTVKATQEIADSIEAVQNETGQAVERMNAGSQRVEQGVDLAQQAGSSLGEIVGNVGELATMIQQIAAAAEEQSAAAEEISRKMQDIDAISAQSNQAAQQTATAGVQLSTSSESLRQLVGRFQVAN